MEKSLSATMYCHKHGVVHRDIKLDNFIYENEDEWPSSNAHPHLRPSPSPSPSRLSLTLTG